MNSGKEGGGHDTTVTYVWNQDEHLSANTAMHSSMYVGHVLTELQFILYINPCLRTTKFFQTADSLNT
jgi:hypothetical protein